MSGDPLDLSGAWSGDFTYPAGAGPVTPFVVEIKEQAGRLHGTISEHDLATGAVIKAALRGTRAGGAVDFTKTYAPGASPLYADPIDYVGILSADGMTVTGVWSLLDWDGRFVMQRDTTAGATMSAEHAARRPERVGR